MRINAEFDREALMKSAKMDWVASPMPGVERKMLDRVGDEVARATSLVRYAPNSYFSEHTHNGGEEFLVLEGVFSDQDGDFPAGTYVRNPIGTRHTPHSTPGCVIFVKLHQFDPGDTEQKSTEINLALTDGEQVLHEYGTESVRLVALSAGKSYLLDGSDAGGELLVLSGQVECGHEQLEPWDWTRLPAGLSRRVKALSDAHLFVKTGHLAKDLPTS